MPQLCLLHIENFEDDRILLSELLRAAGIKPAIHYATSVDEVDACLRRGRPDIVVCDHRLPTLDVAQVHARVRAVAPEVPFIVFSAQDLDGAVKEVVSSPGCVFVSKERAWMLPQRIREMRAAPEEEVDIAALPEKWCPDDGKGPSPLDRLQFEHRLADVLVGMEEERHTLCFLDIDRLQIINDLCGHEGGDALISEVAGILRDGIGQRHVFAHFGGDEFGLLLLDCPLDEGVAIVRGLQACVVGHRFRWDGKVFDVSVTAGVTELHPDCGTVGEVMSGVDSACHAAKEIGRNQLHIHDPHDQSARRRREQMAWVHRLRWGLDESAFVLYGQEIRALKGAGPRHYEVLVRMRCPDGRLAMPGEFIPAAERYGLMVDLDAWIIEHCLAMVRQWEERGGEGLPALNLALNLSAQSLSDQGFLERVMELVKGSGIAPERIHFEITETAMVTNLGNAAVFIESLRALGCRFVLDDFGSGLSSFAYLRDMHVDALKIDGTFVRDMDRNPHNAALVRAINQVGQSLGMETVAEFVENESIFGMLAEMGVDHAQGYWIDMPRPLEAILDEGAALAAAASPARGMSGGRRA